MIHLSSKTGADAFIHALSAQNITHVFGCRSESMLPIHDTLENSTDVQFIEMKHEQAAVHAADGYARASGEVGVSIIGTGAGIANGITGIATAFSDSVPLIVIAWQTCSEQDARSPSLDIFGLCAPITKYHIQVASAEDICSAIQRAKHIAESGRPGPVVVEIPTSILCEPFTSQRELNNVLSGKKKPKKINEATIETAVRYIETARKPVFFIGGGVILSGAAELLREIATNCQIPVVSSLMGISAFNGNNPLYLGMLGMHGTYAANKAVHHCDLLIGIGVRFSDRVTGKVSGFSPKSKKIHVDIDASEINKVIRVDLPIVSDAKTFLSGLKDRLPYTPIRENIKDWIKETSNWQRIAPMFHTSNSCLQPQKVIRLLCAAANEHTIVATDVGQHQIWTAHHYTFTTPRTFLTSGGLGTMGYGLPAAIGAAIAKPRHPVLCVTGDGSFQMNLQEIITAVRYKLPIKIAILKNGFLGMVRQWQELLYNRRYSSVKITAPDVVKLAEAYGAAGYTACSEEEAETIIAQAMQHEGPVLMEFNVMEEENVYPFVPPGQSNDQILLSR